MNREKSLIRNKIWNLLLILSGVFLAVIHFVRVFDNNFWGDEYFSIHMTRYSMAEMFAASANDTHPPLYYLILRFLIFIFGDYGWVYHLTSVIPFLVIVILCITYVKKEFGFFSALVFLFISGTMYNSSYFIVEVRDYEWASLWMLLSFLFCRKVLLSIQNEVKKKDCILFVLFSLFAAYTNYFCVIGLIPVYLILLGYAIYRRSNLKTVIYIWLSTFLFYIPWGIVFIKHYSGNTSKYYKAGELTFLECLEYFFDSKFSVILLGILIASSIVFLIASFESYEKVWVVMGLVLLAFTVALPIIIAKINSPFMYLRHLYPVCPVAWIVLSTSVGRIKYKELASLLVLLLVVPFGILGLFNVLDEEARCNESLDNFLEITTPIIDELGCDLLTNEDIISTGFGSYYFPQVQTYYYFEDNVVTPMIDTTSNAIMIFDVYLYENGKDMVSFCQDSGYTCEKVLENGYFGSYRLDVWKCLNLAK